MKKCTFFHDTAPLLISLACHGSVAIDMRPYFRIAPHGFLFIYIYIPVKHFSFQASHIVRTTIHQQTGTLHNDNHSALNSLPLLS